MTARSALKGLLAVGVAAGAAMAAQVVLERRRMMEPVLPELRHPLLLVPVHLGPGALRLFRRAPVPPAPVAPGVDIVHRTRPGREGHDAVEVFVYDAPGRSRPSGALLWMHGGGYVIGHPVMDH